MNSPDRVPAWLRINLVNWAIGHFPDSPPTKFRTMKKAQLWAIFYSCRGKGKKVQI